MGLREKIDHSGFVAAAKVSCGSGSGVRLRRWGLTLGRLTRIVENLVILEYIFFPRGLTHQELNKHLYSCDCLMSSIGVL